MKKKYLILNLLVVMAVSLLSGCGGGEEAADTSTTNIDTSTPKGKIEQVITQRITEEYRGTEIDSIQINEDSGTDREDDYVALVNLTWTTKNSGKMSKEMLETYSSDLAATVGEKCDNVQEIAIFWTVPYLDADAKCSYEKVDGGMAEMDMMWDDAFK